MEGPRPITAFQRVLLESGSDNQEQIDETVTTAKATGKAALKFAEEAPKPASETALDPAAIYAAPPAAVSPIELLPEGPEERFLTIAEGLREGIQEEMAADGSVVLLGEDVGVPGGFGGAFGIYLGLAEEFGRDRVVDTPISEKAIMGAAVGAAIGGMRTLPDLQYADFVYECMDEIVNEAAKLRYMSGGRIEIPTVLRCPVGATQRGAQHAQSPESLFMHIPGLKVLCVSDAYSAKGGIKAALRDPDPVLVFDQAPVWRAQAPGGRLDPDEDLRPRGGLHIEVGQARLRRTGSDVTVVATFTELYDALAVADRLEGQGISVEVIDPVWLAPFDWAAVLASVRRTGRLVIAHEANLTGGWGAEVAARVGAELFDDLRAPVERVASKDVPAPFAPGPSPPLRPTADDIEDAIRRACARS